MKTVEELLELIQAPYSITIERDGYRWMATIRGFEDMTHKHARYWDGELYNAIVGVMRMAHLLEDK